MSGKPEQDRSAGFRLCTGGVSMDTARQAVGPATRKSRLLLRLTGTSSLRLAERQLRALLLKLPPRNNPVHTSIAPGLDTKDIQRCLEWACWTCPTSPEDELISFCSSINPRVKRDSLRMSFRRKRLYPLRLSRITPGKVR